jgi:nucleoside-diphosphate-sugar epimerase
MRCAVTGASGYVGSRIAARLRTAGWEVRELTRQSGFTLEGGAPAGSLDGVDALVHCAWDFAARSREEIERVNVEGSRRLFSEAAAAGVDRIVFVSTLSAFPGCRSLYGRAKFAVEEHVVPLGAAVVRPGLVWGPEPAGLYGALARLASLRVLPVIHGAKRLHLAHEEDLASLAFELVAGGQGAGTPIVAAAPEPLSLGAILRRIAGAHGSRLTLVPVPWQLPWLGLRLIELAGARPGFRSDSVLSLVSLDETPLASGAAAPPVPFRAFEPV